MKFGMKLFYFGSKLLVHFDDLDIILKVTAEIIILIQRFRQLLGPKLPLYLVYFIVKW